MAKIAKWAAPAAMALSATVASAPATSQSGPPDHAAIAAEQRAAMARLAWMDGRWRGEAVVQTPQGPHRIVQTERIGTMLGGTIRVIEGKGFEADGTAGFNAFGVISYDAMRDRYEFRSYAQGMSGTFPMTVRDTGYDWEIPAGPAKIRYSANLQNGRLREVGHYLAEGQPERQIFEMTLTRIGPTDWPQRGAMAPKGR